MVRSETPITVPEGVRERFIYGVFHSCSTNLPCVVPVATFESLQQMAKALG